MANRKEKSMERNIERMAAAIELLRHMMEEESGAINPYLSLDDLNYVLIVAGQDPVIKKEERNVNVIDTVRD